MTGPESLSADQRAVLQLVLLREQSYAEIAGALRTDTETVRARAHGALVQLNGLPATSSVSADELAVLSDDVLGQPAPAVAELLDRSPAARKWHRSTRESLVAAGFAKADSALAASGSTEAGSQASLGDGSTAPSRTAGAILLGLVAAGLVLVVLWVAGVFDTGKSSATKVPAGTTTTGPTNGTKVLSQINLEPTNGGSAKGAAIVLEQDGRRGIEVVGQGLAASSFYALWTQRGGRWQRIGFFPPVRPNGVDKGKLTGTVVDPPKDILSADRMVISRERERDPKTPNAIVLSGKVPGG